MFIQFPGCFFLSHGSEKNGDCEPICCYLLLKSVLFHFKFLKLPSSFCKLFLTSKAEKKQPCKYMFKYNVVCMHGICSLVFLACICFKSKGAPQTHKWMKYNELSLSKSWPQNLIEWNTNNWQPLKRKKQYLQISINRQRVVPFIVCLGPGKAVSLSENEPAKAVARFLRMTSRDSFDKNLISLWRPPGYVFEFKKKKFC